MNTNSISKNIGLDNKTIRNYLLILHETNLIELLNRNKAGSHKSGRRIYLDNQDLYSTIIEEIGYDAQVGTISEIFFIKMLKNTGHKIYYNDAGVFEVHDKIFEIGGRHKIKKQIQRAPENSCLVKEDILCGNKREIPLYLFGFVY